MGSGPLCIGLATPAPLPQNFVTYQHLDGKDGLVVRALSGHQPVPGGRLTQALNILLEPGLGVFGGRPSLAVSLEIGAQGVEYKPAGCLVALVKVNGRNHRFEGFFQYRVSVTASRLRLSLSQLEVAAKGQAASGRRQAGPANQRRATLGQFAFGKPGKGLVQLGRNYQFQDGISQEFHAFVGFQG